MIKRHTFIITLILAVLLIIPNMVFGAEQWSTPTYTEQWSMPTKTEIWSEPPTPIPWSMPELTPPSSQQTPAETNNPTTYVKLQIGSKDVVVQDKSIRLDVAPITISGRTMVPVRFLGEEALKGKVDWDNNLQKATLTFKDKKVELVVGKQVGLVNGKEIPLDVPVTKVDGRILVPLRFVSENLGLFVEYDPQTKTIEISDVPLKKSDTAVALETPKPSTDWAIDTTQYGNSEAITDFEKLYGTWYIWTGTGFTSLYDKTTGDYVTHEQTHGADQGKIVINKNGTYTMTHTAWDRGVTAEGKWRLSFPAEINGDRIQSIVLLNGISNSDWVVAPAENGKIRLLYAMKWSDGSATWVYDSELYKK